MVIGITGYGATGASACMDLLKEFQDVQYYDPHVEFQLLQWPDGITDLRYNLVESRRRISINTAVVRFIKRYEYKRSQAMIERTKGQYIPLSKAYVDSLVQVTWKGKSAFDPQDILSKYEDYKYRRLSSFMKKIIWKFQPNSTWPPYRTRYYTSISEDEFVEKTRTYLNNIFVASGFDLDKPIMLEQLFCLERPTEGGDYFDDFRTIIVDRDPRDVYVLTNGYLSGQLTSFMPNSRDAEAFVTYYRGLHRTVVNDPRVFYLQYEDLIYRYEETVEKLENFLDLKHTTPRTHFKPEWSINNTRAYEKYPELSEEIKYIKEHLSEMLYPFEERMNNLSFTPEDTGVFDAKPGDRKGMMDRSKKALKKSK